MKIRTRFEKCLVDGLTFLVYLMDHNGKPLEAYYADDIHERGKICDDLQETYGIDDVYHYEDFSIDVSNISYFYSKR